MLDLTHLFPVARTNGQKDIVGQKKMGKKKEKKKKANSPKPEKT